MVISLKTIMNKEGYNSKARQMAKEVYQNIIPPISTTSSKRTRYGIWEDFLSFNSFIYFYEESTQS